MPDELPERCCAKCGFWSPPTEEELAKDPNEMGECLRYPPTLVIVHGIPESWYPDVWGHEWCGEYEPSEPSE